MRDLRISEDVAILGISLYVLGFALGYVHMSVPAGAAILNRPLSSPLVFAPMGEVSFPWSDEVDLA